MICVLIFFNDGRCEARRSLSSTLFNIYINDFSSFISEGKCDPVDSIDFNCLLYADDIVLVALIVNFSLFPVIKDNF